MPKVLNKKHDLLPLGNTVYIGRGSPYGNRYVIGRDGTREEVIAKFRVDLVNDPALMERVRVELRGKDLVCFCAPEACHGDVLLYYANIEEI
jgi:hypothetical protein